MKNILLDKKIYSLNAIFRACSELSNFADVIISDSDLHYSIQSSDGKKLNVQEFLKEVNMQMVRIQLEDKFNNIRNIIVEKALFVNKGITHE